MGRYPKERKVFSSTENDELIPAMCVFFSLLHLINSQMVWWSWKICSERAAAWLLLQAGNKTRREVQVQGWEGHSVNVIACFKALVVCGRSYAARKKCTQVVMETLSDVAKLTFWETRKKLIQSLSATDHVLMSGLLASASAMSLGISHWWKIMWACWPYCVLFSLDNNSLRLCNFCTGLGNHKTVCLSWNSLFVSPTHGLNEIKSDGPYGLIIKVSVALDVQKSSESKQGKAHRLKLEEKLEVKK